MNTPGPSADLRGITWSHSRGLVPLVAASQRFHELHPDVTIKWDARSLQEFADQPLDELSQAYDLLVIDHPWAGYASEAGVLRAWDEVLPAAFLKDQADHSVGPSHASYRYADQQWALAIDAATPVASWRPDLIEAKGLAVPKTWDDLISLAKQGHVAMPGIPQDTLMNFYMLCERPGVSLFPDEDTVADVAGGLEALERLRELASYQDPGIFDWNPINIYEQMTRTDRFAYCPFAYGYSNYSRAGYANTLLKFGDVVAYDGFPLKTTLGGTGLALSSASPHTEIAADFATMVAGPSYQQTQYTENGGQPGHRSAWLDDENNRRTLDYFRDTLPCLDRAYLRPRYPGSLAFQDRDGGGAPIRKYMMDGGDPRKTLNEINQMYRQTRAAGRGASA
ncbi:MAG: extracellular solute-binding protein [Planctomycetota bacterium]